MKKFTLIFLSAAAMLCAVVCNAAKMETVAVIGTGDMGDSLGPRFAELGYRVVYGSRNPASDKVKALVKNTGDNASATTQMEAAQQADIVAGMGLDPVDFRPLRMAREIEVMQMIYMIPLVQNRPEHWEFYFRRSDHYGCYQSGESTSEGLGPAYDAGKLAVFPMTGEVAAPCPD